MKFIHVFMLVSLLGRAQAQQVRGPTNPAQLTRAPGSTKIQNERDRNIYLEPEYNRRASWYVSTDARTLQTSVVFLDSNQRVMYEEVLPRQSVELNSHNRRVLDHALVKLTKRQLVGDRLKTQPIWYKNQGQGMPVLEYIAELPEDTPKLYPTGTFAKVMVSNGNLLYLWCKSPEVEKIKLRLSDGIGVIVRSYSVKKREFTYSTHINELSSGNYELKLYGKTWQNYYQIHVDSEQQQLRVVPLSQ